MDCLPNTVLDKIMSKIPNLNKLGEIRLLNGRFNEIIMNNKDLEYELLLSTIKNNYNTIIRQVLWAVQQNNLDLVKWIITKFKITKQEIQQENKYILIVACMKGYIEIVIWLLDFYKMDIDDIFNENSTDPYFWACLEGHLKIIQLFTKRFNITFQTLKERTSSDVFINICEQNNVEFAKWMIKNYNITYNMVNENTIKSMRRIQNKKMKELLIKYSFIDSSNIEDIIKSDKTIYMYL
jgi:hypothetical protein